MKSIFNLAASLAFLGAAVWIVQDVILTADPAPIGGTGTTEIDDHRGELDTFRQAQ
ncbi:MAG: hypothetical protein F6K16_31130 [Symploca sp. SIO2B6]|nr:hypothetical protein [Symploca sp. SIO2B6]